MNFDANLVSVLVGAIAVMVLGFIWYSPQVFGTIWMKDLGLTKKDMESSKEMMPKVMGLTFVTSLLMSFVVGNLILNVFKVTDVSSATEAAFWLWLGLVATTMFVNQLYNKPKWTAFTVGVFYHLAALITIAIVFVTL